VPEELSDVVEQLLQKQENQPIISQLVEVELFSALSRRVRMGEVSRNDARRITELFENHLNEGLSRKAGGRGQEAGGKLPSASCP
jgi:uncharacterized protein